jgi:GDSL-like Lipase/Acylhydrolase family
MTTTAPHTTGLTRVGTTGVTRPAPARRWRGSAGMCGRLGMLFFCWVWAGSGLMVAAAQPVSALQIQTLPIHNSGTSPAALVCPRKSPTHTRPAAPPAEPTEIPGDQEVEQAKQESQTTHNAQPSATHPLLQGDPRGWRIAIWGDSHMAAAFFSDQMVRQLAPANAAVSSRFVHAGVGHGGVRALVRKTCLSGDWGREMAYAHADAAAAPGPGMTSLVAKRPGASLALDLRDAQGLARHTHLQLLYHGDGTGGTQLAISVDGEAETTIRLAPSSGPSALALHASAAVSSLHIRVVDGPFRFQGLKRMDDPATAVASSPAALHLDLFAYPGATVAGWVRSDLGYLASWFTDPPDNQTYDLALIAFGTNEGNDPRFNETAYRDMLTQAVGNFRRVFPSAQCVLMGPGDRGIRVVKSKAVKSAKKQAAKGKSQKNAKGSTNTQPAKAMPAVNLLKYARIHAQIGQIQSEVATQHGCQFWSMQTAMGGVGSAYAWARQNPPLMAPDLIHFTPAGYRELANRFLVDFGLAQP